jgi:hypothetical protein
MPALAVLLPNPVDPDLADERTWYQQNGAPLYYAVDRWIGRRGQIEWPARSPDLTRLDFFYEDISRIRSM